MRDAPAGRTRRGHPHPATRAAIQAAAPPAASERPGCCVARARLAAAARLHGASSGARTLPRGVLTEVWPVLGHPGLLGHVWADCGSSEGCRRPRGSDGMATERGAGAQDGVVRVGITGASGRLGSLLCQVSLPPTFYRTAPPPLPDFWGFRLGAREGGGERAALRLHCGVGSVPALRAARCGRSSGQAARPFPAVRAPCATLRLLLARRHSPWALSVIERVLGRSRYARRHRPVHI